MKRILISLAVASAVLSGCAVYPLPVHPACQVFYPGSYGQPALDQLENESLHAQARLVSNEIAQLELQQYQHRLSNNPRVRAEADRLEPRLAQLRAQHASILSYASSREITRQTQGRYHHPCIRFYP